MEIETMFNGKILVSVMINYIYETKCLRCDHVSERVYAEASAEGFPAFTKEMEERASRPYNYACSACKKETIQIVIFYGGSSAPVIAPRSYIMMTD
jgi:hypothetical protein